MDIEYRIVVEWDYSSFFLVVVFSEAEPALVSPWTLTLTLLVAPTPPFPL